MLVQRCFHKAISKTAWLSLVGLLSVSTVHSVMAAPSQVPLFLTAPVKPLVMLNMSNDHQLFFKAYDDYSDITDSRPTIDGLPNPIYGGSPDGNADTTYVHAYDYYGYFDSEKCYAYNNSRFEPQSNSSNKYCSGQWSGNFLNWATMTRMDAVRKILYGGMRSTDSATLTVLERSFLPQDAHSFAKYYNGTDISQLTPFSDVTTGDSNTAGITICNTTEPSSRANLSQSDTGAPLIRVAKGNFSLWASNERWQCRWGTGTNDNSPTLSGINAHSSSPTTGTHRLGGRDFIVRVQTCVSNLINGNNNENCQAYGANHKPIGLLQEFGESDEILFGLLTGSYGKNKSGGVLRKNIGTMTNEIDATNGRFVYPTDSIIGTLNRLRIYGYRFDDGTYHGGTGSDNCIWAKSSFNNGDCSNWGNPQSEIYLESLRYLAGTTPTTAFSANDSTRITGLTNATWTKPVTNNNYCAPLSVIQFNASTSSYDSDELSGASGIGLADVSGATDIVGAGEGIYDTKRLIGEIAGINSGEFDHQLCTAKTVNNLSKALGTCPDAPRLGGSYQIAGLAYHARKEGIPLTGVTKASSQTVRTYGVALAPAVPRVTVPVPGSDTQKITILPACRNKLPNPDANCAIVDFKIVEQAVTTIDGIATATGSLYVNWEDSEQGGDFDQDMWGVINYAITSSQVKISTNVIAQSSTDPMGFGYVISGTSLDGFHVHSGMNGFDFTPREAPLGAVINGCDDCVTADNATTNTYAVQTSTAQPLREPLYYAAKWGGYSSDLVKAAEKDGVVLEDRINARDPSDTFFFATDPRQLESSLRNAFLGVKAEIGAAASAATNSSRLNDGVRFYQALFDSTNWSGTLMALSRDAESGELSRDLGRTTDTEFVTNKSTLEPNRKVWTYNDVDNKLVEFQLENLTGWQILDLKNGDDDDDDSLVRARVEWIRGSQANETVSGGMRPRTNLLGDIVNSSPVYAGDQTSRYRLLPAPAGTSYAEFANDKKKIIYVGANDGMVHGFDADTFKEVMAFIPKGVYPKLANLTKPDYGRGANQHRYLVDGPMYVGDAYINGDWETILVGTLGAGGKGIFALNVTNPLAPKLLFEFGPEDYPQLGYVLGQPLIAPLANGDWAVIFGNGYESGTSQLFVVDLEAPYTARVINTNGGTGLSAPALLPNGISQIEYAYAGDLHGNIWKFDLTGAGALSYKLFQAKDDDGNVQPISGSPTLGINELLNGAVMVYFGTGKYFDSADNSTPASPRHSVYAIADTGVPVSSVRTGLHQKSFAALGNKRVVAGEVTADANGIMASAVNWQEKKGWYMDFDKKDGERVIVKPLLLLDRLIFNTIIPSNVPCEYGGESWLMELIAVGDKNLSHTILGDKANTRADDMIVGDPSIVTGEKDGVLLQCGVDGNCEPVELDMGGGYRGRMNWRVLR